MMPLSLTNAASTAELLGKAVRVAEYYGFEPIENALKGGEHNANAVRIDPRELSLVRRDERGLVPLVYSCAKSGLCTPLRPAFIWRPGPVQANGPQRSVSLELHALGVPSAIAEAMLINVAQSIASDIGLERRVVRINSMGAPDSSARYVRELSAYLRKNSDTFSESILARISGDPLGALLALVEKQNPIIARAPQSMEFLNEEERHHLANVLEYLEAANTYYELNPFVLGSRDCWTHTLFEVHGVDENTEESVPLARGGRYDRLAMRAMGGPAAGVGMTLTFELRGTRAPSYERIKREQGVASLYFAHLGQEAKRRSLGVLESLRRANIPVRQSLAYDHLADQMAEAAALSVPFIIIMGYKEATENSIMIRDVSTNAQLSIPLDDLVPYLRRRHLAA